MRRRAMDSDAERGQARGARLARYLFWSHSILAVTLLVAVGTTLYGLIGMNAMIAEVKNEYLADFEEEELVHRSAWSIETEARHAALECRDRAAVARRITSATDQLEVLLRRYADQVSPSMMRAATGYLGFGRRVVRGDVCERLKDEGLARERLLLDEELTNSWIAKLRELRLEITDRELAVHRLGSRATSVGLGLGALALLVALFTARSVARGVTLPLSQLAHHARRVGEGDFSPLPAIQEPFEMAQLSRELERMRARLAEVNELKQAFLASVSHDLRTPLAHMREALSLLSDGTVGPLSPQQQRVVSLALRACDREIRLVSALLDLSRIRSGRPLRPLPGQRVEDILARALDNVRDSAERRQVTLRCVPGAPVPDVCADAVLVETALVNVLNNAIVASPKGGEVRIRRELVLACREGTDATYRCLRILIEDDGLGIEGGREAQIFEPFFTTKRGPEGSGSGLGLPLAREMMRAHGGDLTLLDDSRQGAVFVFWLPVDGAEGSFEAAHQEQGGALPSDERPQP